MINDLHFALFQNLILEYMSQNDFDGIWEHARKRQARNSERWVSEDFQPRITKGGLVKKKTVVIDQPISELIRRSQPERDIPRGVTFAGVQLEWRPATEAIGQIEGADALFLPYSDVFCWSPNQEHPESIAVWLSWPALPRGWD